MLKEVLGTGSTVEEAQQVAIIALSAPDDADVQFEVLELPVKKTFGLFGGSPAKVRAFYEIKEEAPAPAAKEKSFSSAPQKNSQPEKKEERVESTEPAKVIAYDAALEPVKKAHNYLVSIVKGMGLSDATIEISERDGENYLSILCEDDYSLIIGRRGETLDSIQYLVRLVANRGRADDDYIRVSINIGNYRQKRENTLKDIARKSALRVIKYNRNVSLEPMNPFERRIIHTVIADMKGVSSHSVGSDAERRVIITPEGGSRPASKGGYNKGSYNNKNRGPSSGSSNNRGGRPNNNHREDRPKYEPSVPQRAPKSDAAGTSLYGKIEPKK
ncbi:MAG: RNA-binding cell elongation regulator Jag/EloR [Oscillospiraceae bacterium]